MRLIARTILITVITALASQATACVIDTAERDFGVFKEAEIIVRAKIVRIDIVPYKLRGNWFIDGAKVGSVRNFVYGRA